MSRVEEPGVCYCPCHDNNGVIHCAPCCERCPVCKRNIKHLAAHIDACQGRFDKLVTEAKKLQ